jgi:hypothetical protein
MESCDLCGERFPLNEIRFDGRRYRCAGCTDVEEAKAGVTREEHGAAEEGRFSKPMFGLRNGWGGKW